MLRRMAIAVACLSFAVWLGAHTIYTTKITWSSDVSRLMYRHCASCHRSGGPAFSLMSYKEARPWAEAIKQQVLQRRMPPWNAVKGFGEFKDDAGLTQEDLELIGEWVDGGAPEGNPAYLPQAPDFSADPEEGHARSHQIEILGTKVMRHGVEAIGIEPNQLPATGVMQVIARRADGEIDPLLWIENFNPKFNQPYYFRAPLHFPAGTTIEITPKAGRVALIVEVKQ